MNQLTKKVSVKAFFALAMAVVGVSSGWVWQQQARIRRVQGEQTVPALSGSAYVATHWQRSKTTVPPWSRAPAQSQGGGWLYEVFTPPVIYYNTMAHSFAVTSPHYPTAPGGALFGLELLAVKLEPFRLQLLGYFGEPGDYLAAFVSPHSPETFIARAGRRFEQLGLTLKSFNVCKVAVQGDETGSIYDIAALAVLQDEQNGAEVVLDSRFRKLTDTPLAVFQYAGASAKFRELHEGDIFSDDDATYRIERIQFDPPEVVVARTTPGLPVPELRVLQPAARMAGHDTKPGLLSQQPGRGVATSP